MGIRMFKTMREFSECAANVAATCAFVRLACAAWISSTETIVNSPVVVIGARLEDFTCRTLRLLPS